MKLEDLVCNAYAYLEFDCDFDKYYNEQDQALGYKQCVSNWKACKADYRKLNEYMGDHAIAEMWEFVIQER